MDLKISLCDMDTCSYLKSEMKRIVNGCVIFKFIDHLNIVKNPLHNCKPFDIKNFFVIQKTKHLILPLLNRR